MKSITSNLFTRSLVYLFTYYVTLSFITSNLLTSSNLFTRQLYLLKKMPRPLRSWHCVTNAMELLLR